MVKLRRLVNSAILNEAKWINFFGDSEYEDDNGETIMGNWAFIRIMEWDEVPPTACPYRLDNEIDEEDLFSDNPYFAIENDNGILCLVKFFYDKDNC